MIIESKNNKLILYAKKLQTKKYSLENSECFLEDIKIIREKLNSLDVIFINRNFKNQFLALLKTFKGKIYEIDDKISEFLSESSNPSKIFAIMKIKENQIHSDKFLVLDNLQDPNNVGAIIRSALAFNFRKIYAINSVYPYLYKTIRSSMGYLFDIDYQIISKEDFIKLKKEKSFILFSADMSGESIKDIKSLPKKNIGLVIGNEGQGISSEIEKICDKTIAIPMNNNVESLNASVSASILMYFLNM